MPESDQNLGVHYIDDQGGDQEPPRNDESSFATPEPDDWFEQLMAILRQRSGVSDLKTTTKDGITQISIDTKPQLETDIAIDQEGKMVFSFGRKFEEGFEGWKPGDRINSKFIVQCEGEGLELLVADSVVGDIRHADMFNLGELSSEEQEALMKVGMAEIDVDIEVASDPRYEVSDMYRYDAKITKVNAIQQAFNGDFSKIKSGDRVLVEGRVLSYEKGQGAGSANKGNDYGVCQVQLPDGKVIPITLWNGYLQIDGGNLDVISPNHPVENDVIQINSNYGNPGARYGGEHGLSLYAYFCRSTFLLEASPNRAQAYESQRHTVESRIQAIEASTDPQTVRLILSNLIRSNMVQGTVHHDLAFNNEEVQRLQETIERVIPNPDDRPLNLYNETYVADEINKVWGVDVYAMSRSEFLNFCMQLARGEITYREPGSVDYPYRLIDTALTTEEQLAVLTSAVKTLHAKVTGKRQVLQSDIEGQRGYDPSKLAQPNTVDWHTNYLFEQSLVYLSKYSLPEVSDIYIELVNRMDTENLFTTNEAKEADLKFYEYKIFDSMKRNIQSALIWRNGSFVEVSNQDVIARYEAQLPNFKRFSKRLKNESWNNDGRYQVANYLDSAIELIEHAKDMNTRNNFLLN